MRLAKRQSPNGLRHSGMLPRRFASNPFGSGRLKAGDESPEPGRRETCIRAGKKCRESFTFGVLCRPYSRTPSASREVPPPDLTSTRAATLHGISEVTMTRKKESGQALVFGVVVLGIVLMGFAGLGIDVGVMRYDKRLQQTAADAAAIAGASNIAAGGVTAGAHAASKANSFTDGQNNVTVTVHNGPTSGPHNGNSAYVEVLVAAIQPTYFMRILGINNQTVTARAVATTLSGGVQNGCLYTLGAPPSAILGVNIIGNATLNATSCGIIDNRNFDPIIGA